MTTLMTIRTQYPYMDDARLAIQARSDPEAFAELYRRHVLSIYRYHLAHTGNVKDAEDLTSQTRAPRASAVPSTASGGRR